MSVAENNKVRQVVYITPGSGWASINFAELWAYRELLYFLIWREVKIRYKQTVIGVFWAVLQPVLTTIIFALIFSQVARFDSPTVPYPLFVLSGLLIWLFVNNSIIFSSNSLVGSSNLVTKIYFPRLLLPLASVFAGLIDLAIGFVILVLTMIYFGVSVSLSVLYAPLFLILGVILSVSVGTLLSALNVRFRDVKFALPFALQVWMFASPIFYPFDILSPNVQKVFALNPLTGVLHGFRSALFGSGFDWPLVATSVVGTLAIVGVALFVFSRMEDDFSDMI